MKIEDVFRIETTGPGRSDFRMVPRRAIETRDGKMLTVKSPAPRHPMIYRRPTQDTVISTVTPEEDREWSKRMATMSGYDGGLLWQGDFQPVGNAVNQVIDALRRVKGSARARDALSQAVCAIANYGNYLETSEAEGGTSGALAFTGSVDEMRGGREEDGSGHDVDGKPSLSKAATGDSGGAHMRKLRDLTGNDVASINAQNAAYWDKQAAWQKR